MKDRGQEVRKNRWGDKDLLTHGFFLNLKGNLGEDLFRNGFAAYIASYHLRKKHLLGETTGKTLRRRETMPSRAVKVSLLTRTRLTHYELRPLRTENDII